MRTVWLFVVLLALGGCVTRTLDLNSSFNPEEGAYINQIGENIISGQAFLRRNDGIVVYAAGSEVNLIPVTQYSNERIAKLYEGAKYLNIYAAAATKIEDLPAGFLQQRKSIKANGEGRFVFSNIADGEYFIVTKVVWIVGDSAQGGSLVERVLVAGGQNLDVVMNGQ